MIKGTIVNTLLAGWMVKCIWAKLTSSLAFRAAQITMKVWYLQECSSLQSSERFPQEMLQQGE